MDYRPVYKRNLLQIWACHSQHSKKNFFGGDLLFENSSTKNDFENIFCSEKIVNTKCQKCDIRKLRLTTAMGITKLSAIGASCPL